MGNANAACGTQGLVCANCPVDTECQQGHCVRTGYLSDGGRPARRVEVALPIPQVFWVLDRTGSIAAQLEGTAAQCALNDGGTCLPDSPCTPACPSRFTGVRNTLGSLLAGSGSVARHASAMYPTSLAIGTDGGCRIPTPEFVIPDAGTQLAAELSAAAAQVLFRYADGGLPGTSSNISLGLASVNEAISASVATTPTMVVMLTDGLPNCNEQNPLTCANKTTCGCDEAPSTCPAVGTPGCTTFCTDGDAFTNAVSNISRAGVVPVMLVGVGGSVSTSLFRATFNGAAAVSGLVRSCTSDAQCGGAGDTCDTATGRCAFQYHRVTTLAGIPAVKAAYDATFDELRKCTVLLDEPAASAISFSVTLNGAPVSPGTNGWTRAQPRLIRFNGTACATLKTKGLTALTVDQPQ